MVNLRSSERLFFVRLKTAAVYLHFVSPMSHHANGTLINEYQLIDCRPLIRGGGLLHGRT